MVTTTDRLLDNSEAAEMLSVSPATLVKMRERGEIDFVRLSDSRKGFRYSAHALETFIANRLQRNEQPRPAKKGKQ